MPSPTEHLLRALRPHEPELLELARAFRDCPEPGYGEWRTVELWRQFAVRHGLDQGADLEGLAPVITLGDFANARTRIFVTADLDAVRVRVGDSTDWRHLCGHYAQSVHALGIALLWLNGALPDGLALRLVGTPAEECLPAYVTECPVPFLPGKRRLLDAGTFSGADAVLGAHLADALPRRAVRIAYGAHGGIWLRAKNCRLEADAVRRAASELWGGFFVSDRVWRTGETQHALLRTRQADGKWPPTGDSIARRLSLELGADWELVAEYAPLLHDPKLRQRAKSLLSKEPPIQSEDVLWLAGVSDLGDVSRHHPTLQVFVGGTAGTTHDEGFHVIDDWFAHIWPSAFLAKLAVSLHERPL